MSVITVSKESGCGDEVCFELANILKYKIINRELMEYAARIAGIDKDIAKKLDDREHKTWNAIWSELFDFSLFSAKNLTKIQSHKSAPHEYENSPSGQNYKKAIDMVIHKLADENNVIIVGKGGNFILKGHPDAFHIRLLEDIDTRIKNVSKSMGINEIEARKYIEETEHNKSKYTEYYFDRKIEDNQHYDLIINLRNISEKRAAALIAHSIKEIEINTRK